MEELDPSSTGPAQVSCSFRCYRSSLQRWCLESFLPPRGRLLLSHLIKPVRGSVRGHGVITSTYQNVATRLSLELL